jgi:hypothetical protein
MDNFSETLEGHGASLNKLLLFDQDSPDLLPYATLKDAIYHRDSDIDALRGVYEWQENPLIFLIDGDQLKGEEHFRAIRRMVAMRGDTPYLGVVRPGQLTVHRLTLDEASPTQSQVKIDLEQPRFVFSYLINQRPGIKTGKQTWISDVVLKLLQDSIRSLAATGLTNEEGISIAGRALFTRFLADRELSLPPGTNDPTQLFDDPETAKNTSIWLDETFNGDFLPLHPNIFERLKPEAFRTLGNILRRAPGGQLHLDWKEDWAHLDFAHIPVGVLSQAYEQYMRTHDKGRQRKEGSYYTPRSIVELMVSGAFHGLRREGKAHLAKVLDPAVGAGVFLISTFRHLVAERWKHDKKRPDTETLRKILYEQIRGFDVNEEALRFAALGLYLISIELDPNPEPVEKLRFENLRGKVLFKFAGGNLNRPLGSLGPEVSNEHLGRYDLVIGNPPWTTGTKLPQWEEVRWIVSRIAKNRLPEKIAPPPLPNEGLDLPFLWRAMEWARKGGQISMLLHARFLFQQGEGTPEAREAVFQALDVKGIFNGTELCETKVWPGINAPFCILFAKNQNSFPGSGFRFATPHIEVALNDSGSFRLDALNAQKITLQDIINLPEILKILFRGTQLDLEIFQRFLLRRKNSLKNYWKSLFGEFRGRPCQSSTGYQRIRGSSRIRKSSNDNQPGVSADYLLDLPEITQEAMECISINHSKLKKFSQKRIHDPRPRSLFKGPLLLVHQSRTSEAGRIRVAISDEDIVYNETYFGYSSSGHEEAGLLVRYIALIIGSKPAYWYALMSSGKFGFERRVIEKITIDKMPIIPIEDLKSNSKNQIMDFFDDLTQEESEENWQKVDAWIAEIFGLNQRDLQTISDTLEYNLPFSQNKKKAQASTDLNKNLEFCQFLESELSPLAQREKNYISINIINELPRSSPWKLLRLETRHTFTEVLDDWSEILRIADEIGTTEVILPDKNGLWIARLNQARYWSQSQARLLARRIIWEHKDTLFRRSNVA